MGDFVLNVMGSFGYIGIFFLIAIENLFPPIPSEVILTFGGFLTTYTDLTILGVVISSTLGSLIGAIILYYFGSFISVKSNDLGKTSNWFNKYGTKSVLLGRFIPIIRSLISIPAGINKMNFKLFLFYTLIGSFIWNLVLVTVGSLLGSNWHVFAAFLSKYSKVVIIGIIIILLMKILKKLKVTNN